MKPVLINSFQWQKSRGDRFSWEGVWEGRSLLLKMVVAFSTAHHPWQALKVHFLMG
ncbi:hypothetical protein [Leptolyngbya sp. CCY15150]|uniref:hypothetical protein n=1 Tax=Leptolyngbya sp. CCY15150 TaxID=2767772 RepID=UPI00194DD322|nr:hypothetical protein [Leptolyngbya sp. CCY15150]